jgi:hypothetical protein
MSCSTIVDKQHKQCKDTFVLDQSFGVHHDMYACFVVPVQIYYKCTREYLWKKSCICSIYDARHLTTCSTDVAVPKSLVLLFGVDTPLANAQKLS